MKISFKDIDGADAFLEIWCQEKIRLSYLHDDHDSDRTHWNKYHDFELLSLCFKKINDDEISTNIDDLWKSKNMSIYFIILSTLIQDFIFLNSLNIRVRHLQNIIAICKIILITSCDTKISIAFSAIIWITQSSPLENKRWSLIFNSRTIFS